MWACRQGHRAGFTSLDPPACLICGGRLYPPLRPVPEGFDQFDHTFTPRQATIVLNTIPPDSYHWADIERLDGGRVGQYTKLMAEGKWVDQTLARGFQDHPVRWDENGQLTHGAIRLLACAGSGRNFRTAVVAPQGLLQEMFYGPARLPGMRHAGKVGTVGDTRTGTALLQLQDPVGTRRYGHDPVREDRHCHPG
jgi:hypothetical protein